MAAIRRKMYVLRSDAFDILAGDDPALRIRATNEPNITAISTAAGLDSTTLLQLKNNQIGLSIWVKAALVDFLMKRGRGRSRASAEKALFDLVDAEPPAPRQRRAVPA